MTQENRSGGGSGSLAGEDDKINGNGVGKNRQPQVVEGYEEEEQYEGQGDVGLLKLAGWAVRLFFQDGIGMKKIDEGNEDEKEKHVEEKESSSGRFFH